MAEKHLNVSLQTLDANYRMSAESHGARVELDAGVPTGKGDDLNPMENVLASLAACASMTMLISLRNKQSRHVGGLRVKAKGTLGDAPPNTYESIDLCFEFVSTDASEQEIQHALDMAESKLCPVWALLKGNVEVNSSFTISEF